MIQRQTAAPRGMAISAFDGMRGLGMLMIVAGHSQAIAALLPGGTDVAPSRIDYSGYYAINALWPGLAFFIVLTGFLITRSLRRAMRGESTLSLPAYIIRRVRRVVLPYWALLALYYFVFPGLGANDPDFAANWAHQAWFWLGAPNYYMNATGGYAGALSPLWYLGVTLHVYALWPILMRIFPGRRFERLAWAVIAGSLVYRIVLLALGFDELFLTRDSFARLDGFFVGTLLALWSEDPERWSNARRRAVVVFWTSAAGWIGAVVLGVLSTDVAYPVVASTWLTPPAVTVALSAQNIAVGAVVVLAMGAGRIAEFFDAALLRSVGRYSYGMYLWNVIAMGLLALAGFEPNRLTETIGVPLSGMTIYILVVAIVTYLFGVVNYHAIERWVLPEPQPAVAPIRNEQPV